MVDERQPAADVSQGWGVPFTAVHCAHCGEEHLVPEDAVGPRCPFCLQTPVMTQPVHLEELPEQVVPYAVSASELARILERWMEGVRFRPADLHPQALVQRARRYLVPLWLVDGRVEGVWRADVGFDYQAVSYQDRYRDGAGWSSQEVQEGRVRWEPRVGRIDRTYENVISPALEDHRQLLRRLGDFDLEQRTAYQPEAMRGATVRVPTLSPQAAWTGAEMAFVRTAGKECQRAADAHHIRHFTLEAAYHDLNWTLLLLPAYVTWYREGERTWPVLVNGQSGRVSGVRRADARKANTTSLALGGVAALLFVIGAILALSGALLPPLLALGGLVLIVGLMVGIVAPIPAISVWIHNRRTASQLEEWKRP